MQSGHTLWQIYLALFAKAFIDPAALLGYCHLEGRGQRFETQPQTAWVSFGKQKWVTSRTR
jgi:hypothetical protein